MMSAMDINTGVDPYPSDRSYITAHASFLSEGSKAILPCTIRYMDLTWLELELPRCEPLMLIRDEWRAMVDIFNERPKGRRGSAIFTGQPGIGKYCYCS
jgi:hypothetical protein